MKAVAKKPYQDSAYKKRHNTVRSALKNFHTINHSPPVPVIQPKPICPCDGGCPRCAPVIQPKLIIGQPNDKYEQEADRVADQVMRTTVGSRQKAVGSDVNTIQKQVEEAVQPKPT